MRNIVRTQIYLTAEQKAEIDRIAARKGSSMTQIVREAVAEYVKKEKPLMTSGEAMAKYAGLWKGRKEIGDGVAYQRKLRAGWGRRLRRIYGRQI